MTLAQLALWLAALAGSAATALHVAAAVRGGRRVLGFDIQALARRLLAGAASLVLAAFLFLLSRFVAADVAYQYVFLYTSTELELPWRIAGTWAGREGSLLLWATWSAAVAWSVVARHARAAKAGAPGELEERAHAWTWPFLSALSAAFLWAVAVQDTFAPTPDFFLDGRPEGNGLNPTLKSQFILIHPPLMFAAYALAMVPAAAALGHLASGTDRWSSVTLHWTRLDWLLYTVAMGLGGLWAYYTLGFGGYWAWDPVEVANLLPWLALGVLLHAQLHHARHGDYRVAGPFLALLPFLLTLFSTISTRSGLWVSVHAFTDPTNTFDPDAPARFLAILGVEPSLLFPVRLFLAVLGVGLALWCLRLAREHHALHAYARVLAALLAAYGALAAFAPAAALALLFEAARRLPGVGTGVGLLLVLFAACVAAASPALFGNAPPAARSRRLDLRTLAYFAILTLGVGLLVLFLFHAAAVNGWDTAFYERRLPWLAAPALLGLIVMLGHTTLGRRRSLVVAGGALVGALAAAGVAHSAALGPPGGVLLALLAVVASLLGLDKVRRAALPPGVAKAQWLAPTLLWLAALLDLLFWLNPPARVGFAGVTWRPVWPAQFVLGAVAAYVLWQAHRILAGAAPRRSGHVHLLAGALGGFVLAAPLALGAWLLRRRGQRRGQGMPAGPIDAKAKARLRQAALFGIHLSVCLVLLGYAASTYWKESQVTDVAVGSSFTVAGHEVRVAAVEVAPDGAFADRFATVLDLDGRRVTADLQWEGQAAAHFPLPATLRLWDGDVYTNVRSLQVTDSCGPPRNVTAYEAGSPPRACRDAQASAVEVEAIWLPFVGVVWLALALFTFYGALLIATSPPPPSQRAGPSMASAADVGPKGPDPPST